MFVLIILATVCLASSSVLAAYDKPYYDVEDAESLFKDFIKQHNKVYTRQEYRERLNIFKTTLDDINERNDMYQDTVFVVNYFADLKNHEWQQYLGFNPPNETATEFEIPSDWASAPPSWDWRQHNAVTPVKNQGGCGSCFIFSAVGEIEGQYAIKHSQLMTFSEQEALDCLDVGTCHGGWMSEVMAGAQEWIFGFAPACQVNKDKGDIFVLAEELAQRKMKLTTDDKYPYNAKENTCNTELVNAGIAQTTGAKRFVLMDEDKLATLVATHGPVSVALNAGDIKYYYKGILRPQTCQNRALNHALLLVGYGEENGIKYWIIKNSWGTAINDEGYVKLLRGVNACGMGIELATSSVA